MNKVWKKLLFPPAILILLLGVISAAALVAVFLRGWEQTVMAYCVYALAFYSLSVAAVYFVLVFPKRYKAVKEKLYANPLGNRFLTDRGFRTKVSLQISLAINLLYVGIHLWSWRRVGSWWFVVLAVYYGILAVMRYLLVGYARGNALGSDAPGEWKRSRSCGYILLLINLCLSGAVLMILYQNRGYEYPGVLIYVMALYTFYSTVHAVVEIVKYRRLGSPVMSTAKIVSLSASLVSMLNLETAMFAQFGADMPREDQNLMIMLTGAGISITVITLSVILIVKATKEIRRENYGT